MKCKECNGWAMAHTATFHQPVIEGRLSKGSFAPEAHPGRPCERCNATGIEPQKALAA